METLDATIHNAIRAARQRGLSDAEITKQIENTLREFFNARVYPR